MPVQPHAQLGLIPNTNFPMPGRRADLNNSESSDSDSSSSDDSGKSFEKLISLVDSDDDKRKKNRNAPAAPMQGPPGNLQQMWKK